MANIKLGDLCKEIDASYKEMMTYLRERGCDVKSAGSIINDEDPEVKIAITLYGKKKRRAAAKLHSTTSGSFASTVERRSGR